MKTLILYATKHGAACEIATRIAKRKTARRQSKLKSVFPKNALQLPKKPLLRFLEKVIIIPAAGCGDGAGVLPPERKTSFITYGFLIN